MTEQNIKSNETSELTSDLTDVSLYQSSEVKTFKQIQIHKPYSKQNTDYIRNVYNKYKQHNIQIPEGLNEELAKRFPNYDPEKQIFDNFEKILQAEAQAKQLQQIVNTSKNGQIIVSIKTVKTKNHIKYNDVLINGNRILSNHIDTEIKLLCDNTVLAIHGTVTNDEHYPETPTWLAYNTQIQSLNTSKVQNFSGYYAQIKHISDTNDTVNIFLDNKTTIVLKKDKLKKIANGLHFVLEKKKTR